MTMEQGFPVGESITPAEGLTSEEANYRLANGLGNAPIKDNAKTPLQILISNLLTWFNLLNLALGVCLALVGSYRNMLFLNVVLMNAIIGTVQELRANSTIRKLKVLNMPTATVIRDGVQVRLRSEALVKGDLIVLHGSDQVPADAVIIEGRGSANESLLTGESNAVQKGKGDWLMSGSYIVEGRLKAQLVRVGSESYAAQLTHSARKVKRAKSHLMLEMNQLIKYISMILLPLGAILFLKQILISKAPIEIAVPSAVAAVVGMIPEGLVLLTSVAMALGVIRLGRRRTLVQELSGIETLARADVLCLDKTGTLTSGDMQVDRIVPVDVSVETVREKLADFLSAFDESTATLNALRTVCANCAGTHTEAIAVLSFSSARKKSAVSFEDGKTLILGAPSFALGRKYTGEIKAQCDGFAADGSRVLALAEAHGVIDGDDAPEVTSILGLFLITDSLRLHVQETMRYFEREGVEIRVISGDDPRTVSTVARKAGVNGWDRWIDATTLKTEAEIADAVSKYVVFGRVTPDQKKRMVEALKKQGHNVAMTGDGVNDIPALKAADCSIAIAGGSDAAKQAAQLTLLDADFSIMPEIVGEGRRVIANISRSATLFLTKTMFSVALAVLLLFLPGAYPFQPIQLTLISALFIGAPSFVLALEPNTECCRGSFLRRVLLKAAPGAAAVTICAACSMLLCGRYGQAVCSTLATLSAGFVSQITLIRIARPFNALRGALVVLMAIGFVGAVLLLGRVFYLVPLNGEQIWVLAGLCVGGLMVSILMMLIYKKRKIDIQ